jgi:hypothetical protein
MTMSAAKQWAFGDKVRHTAKPEWGAGVVTTAAGSTHEGKPCQSLTIRFDRAGVKTISTAFAKLVAADEPGFLAAPRPDAFPDAEEGEPDPFLGARDPREIMSKLPDAATDPFTTPANRLKATLVLYKYQPVGASLLDWAAVQSGLSDPLSRFNRHELERFFEGFVLARDNHLKKLVQEMKKVDPAGLALAAAGATGAARQALRRLDTGR